MGHVVRIRSYGSVRVQARVFSRMFIYSPGLGLVPIFPLLPVNEQTKTRLETSSFPTEGERGSRRGGRQMLCHPFSVWLLLTESMGEGVNGREA